MDQEVPAHDELPTSSRRAVRWILVGLAVLVVVVVLVPIALFVLPAGDSPTQADAVVVLSGPGPRIEEGERLIAEGFSDVMVLSTHTPDNCTPDVPAAAQYCFSPDPDTTQGEARAVADLAREHGWHRLLVVAQNEQARRARIRLERCLPDDVDVRMITVRDSAAASAGRVVYETGALPKALLLERSC